MISRTKGYPRMPRFGLAAATAALVLLAVAGGVDVVTYVPGSPATWVAAPSPSPFPGG